MPRKESRFIDVSRIEVTPVRGPEDPYKHIRADLEGTLLRSPRLHALSDVIAERRIASEWALLGTREDLGEAEKTHERQRLAARLAANEVRSREREDDEAGYPREYERISREFDALVAQEATHSDAKESHTDLVLRVADQLEEIRRRVHQRAAPKNVYGTDFD